MTTKKSTRASDLFKDRPEHLPSVMVRSIGDVGCWGRGKTVEEAVMNSKWLRTREKVEVFLCSDDAQCGPISGGIIRGEIGPVYTGQLMASHDVKVTGGPAE